MSTTVKTKKLDIFNLFYSGAAVVILIGVIAKLLEWPAQDLLITGGLAIEAVVFGVSAIKFIDVEVKQDVATEATLSKVAEGLGTIAANAKAAAGETYINIQTGTENSDNASATKATSNNGSAIDTSNRLASEKNVSIEIHNAETTAPTLASTTTTASAPVTVQVQATPMQLPSNAHTLWQLEQLDILSLAKDLFFQPKWDNLSSEEYTILSQIFKRVFDKKLPNKEALQFLLQFPVKLPIPEINKLTIEKSHNLDASEIELLCKALTMIGFNSFFENFILELSGEAYLIRPKKVGDLQIYGGEEDIILAHANSFFAKELIVGPHIECLQSAIKLKGQTLLEFFIQKVDIKKEDQLGSLINLLQSQSDDLKKKLWSRFKKIKYNQATSDGYAYLKLLAQSAISFSNTSIGAQLFNRIIEIQINDKKTITLNDVVNFSAETIYFGAKNEYSVNLKELFVNGELENLGYTQTLIEKLISENVASKAKLMELFSLDGQDSKKEVFDKLNYHLAKNNTSPSGAQLAFVLLYKQYQNS